MDIRLAKLGLPAAALAALIGLASTTPAAAQQGTPEQRAACEGDATRLCGQFVPDVQKITACMHAKRRFLSPRCRVVFYRTKKKGGL
ncbi:MAG TPA: hypothetical protein VLL30_05435 [Reyranella sp.]|nr:hypothetical protein [Reyranella sp.]